VTYNVTIGFDTTDIRIKPGMSVSSAIITNIRQDVVTVPSSAVKTARDGSSYVLAFDTPPTGSGTAGNSGVLSPIPPKQITVTAGISSDTETEIVSGLTDGQEIVMKTTIQTAASATTAPSILGSMGGNRSGASGGTMRGVTGGGGTPRGN